MDHVSWNAEYKAGSKRPFLQEASVAPALAKIHDVRSATKVKSLQVKLFVQCMLLVIYRLFLPFR
jgi:hypothetical protein